ncbi:MAG: V-type ATP synthase subunit E [Ruminococcaceae bacterium]|nr:V-type ATP synthase subunit E [Oscillospiraceae bacterium]MBQ7302441.1 V-type ATP synthase subunit E [Clostridia bacterium]
MEVQLQELIDQIKKDGVEAAETEAEAIVKAAKENAEQIIADAQAQADKILAGAKSETERMTKSSEDAIRQAGRNLLISFRESVTRELNAIVGENVTAVYSSDALASLIVSIIENWANKPEAEDIAVILNAQDLNKLEETLLAALKEKMLKGITLKANDNFDGGFRIAVNNGSAYYDYSAEAVVDMLSNYLSPKVTELLKEAK